jgi:hypothetical protein
MGSFFSPYNALTSAEFLRLSNITDLVLGTTRLVSVQTSDFVSLKYMNDNPTLKIFDSKTSVGYKIDTDSTRSDYGHYCINLRYYYPSYYESTGSTTYSDDYYDVLDIGPAADGSSTVSFRMINSDATNPYYASEIDLSHISADSLDAYDMFRVIMAFDPTKTTRIVLSKAENSLIPGYFSKFFGNRVSISLNS